jgi:RNA polymerase sigma-70 factor (ECF subfamily)
MAALDTALRNILENLQRGLETERSFRTLFERYYGRVLHFLQRRTTTAEDAHDLAQEVFLAVHRDIGHLRDLEHFESWLFAVTRNVVRSHLDRTRAAKRPERTAVAAGATGDGAQEPGVDAIPDPRQSPLDGAIDRQHADLLRRSLTTLPPQMRQCVMMRVADDAPLEQIARHMQISVNTVKAHLHQARRLLRKRLEPVFGPLDFTGEKEHE